MKKNSVIKVHLTVCLGNTVVRLPIPMSALLGVQEPYNLEQQRENALDFAMRLQITLCGLYPDRTVDVRPIETYQCTVDLRSAKVEPSLFIPKC